MMTGAVWLATGGVASAVDRVLCVPWQGDPLKQHTVTAGNAALLKCVVKTDSTATRWYQWSFGDGTPDSAVTTTSGTKLNLQTTHAYAGATGTPFTATLRVDKVDASMSNAVTGNYLVKIEDNNLDAQINIAIDKGLWNLYTNANNGGSTYDGSPFMSWYDTAYGVYASPTASTVQAFGINNHKFHGDPTVDPYVEAVQLGMNFLMKGNVGVGSTTINDSAWNVPAANGNPNGIAIYTNYSNHHVYETGQVMDAIVASGVLPTDSTGRDFSPNSHIWTYGEVLQDMADAYVYWQHPTYGAWGEWEFWSGQYDNSSSQWAAIGLIPAQAPPWNVKVPASLKSQNATWLNYSYCASGGTGYAPGGYFGYQGACGSYNDAAFNTTPSGMVMMAMDGQVGFWDPANPATPVDNRDPKWIGAEKFMADNWGPFISTLSNSWGRERTYGYYAMAKALRLAVPHQVEFIRKSNGTAFDWYRGDANNKGMAQRLLDNQYADGHWTGELTGTILPTAWMTIVLKPALFAAAPIACFTAAPNPSFANQDITFDPACSGHSETGKTIANLKLFEWDWNNDGVFEDSSTTPTTATHQFPCATLPCAYPVKLRVTDDAVPPLTATTVVTINITNPPHPPVANAGGPYTVSMCVSDSLALDGSASFDQDQGQHQTGGNYPNDTITAWDWDLKAPLTDFTDKSGVKPTVAGGDLASFFTAGSNTIALRVTDNTALAYPGSGQPNLTNVDFATVNVASGCLCELTAIAKAGMVQLNWSAMEAGATYTISRSTAGPNTGFAVIRSGYTNAYPLFVDTGLTNGKTYYYRVTKMSATGAPCASKAVSGKPVLPAR